MSRLLSLVVVGILAWPVLAQSLPDLPDLPEPTSERVLIPLLIEPVHGAYGSKFHTDLRIANNSDDPVLLLGIETLCVLLPCPPRFNGFPTLLLPQSDVEPDSIIRNGTPGRFVSINKDDLEKLSMHLRVYDVTREESNYGTEIPLVRERDFAINRLELIGVPTDPRFRNTLRIYAETAIDVDVKVGNRPAVRVPLKGGISLGNFDFSKPAYAMFTDFPIGSETVHVSIVANPGIVTLLPLETPIWAFITVTNNETQAISTITPQP